MLALLQNLILPPSTAEKMSPADWLMTVLAIYFNDLGMLVTNVEYRRRAESGFVKYRDEVLLSPDDIGRDYAHKIQGLLPDEQERFLYQEFVRHQHVARIKAWILGTAPEELGIALFWLNIVLGLRREAIAAEPRVDITDAQNRKTALRVSLEEKNRPKSH